MLRTRNAQVTCNPYPPFQGPSYAQFVHMLVATYIHRVCKRGVGPCARCRGGGRTGAFELPEGDPVWGADAPGPRAAGAPFTSMELEKGARRRLEKDYPS